MTRTGSGIVIQRDAQQPRPRADELLGALVRLAAADGHDDSDAVLVLLHLLSEGAELVAARLADQTGDAPAMVVGDLTLQIRSFPWRRRTARMLRTCCWTPRRYCGGVAAAPDPDLPPMPVRSWSTYSCFCGNSETLVSAHLGNCERAGCSTFGHWFAAFVRRSPSRAVTTQRTTDADYNIVIKGPKGTGRLPCSSTRTPAPVWTASSGVQPTAPGRGQA